MTDQIHTCSVYCTRPECIQDQRDAFRDWIIRAFGSDALTRALVHPADTAETCTGLTCGCMGDQGPEA